MRNKIIRFAIICISPCLRAPVDVHVCQCSGKVYTLQLPDRNGPQHLNSAYRIRGNKLCKMRSFCIGSRLLGYTDFPLSHGTELSLVKHNNRYFIIFGPVTIIGTFENKKHRKSVKRLLYSLRSLPNRTASDFLNIADGKNFAHEIQYNTSDNHAYSWSIDLNCRAAWDHIADELFIDLIRIKSSSFSELKHNLNGSHMELLHSCELIENPLFRLGLDSGYNTLHSIRISQRINAS